MQCILTHTCIRKHPLCTHIQTLHPHACMHACMCTHTLPHKCTFTQKHTWGYTFSYHNMSSHAAKVHTHMRIPPNINIHPLMYSTENSAQCHEAAGWEGSLGGNGHMGMYGRAPLRCTWNYHTAVNYARMLSHSALCDFVTPRTGAHQAPLSMGLPRQEYWSGLPRPSPGHLSYPRIISISPALAGGFFTTEKPGKPG